MNTIDVHVHAVPRALLNQMAAGAAGFDATRSDGEWLVDVPGYGRIRPAGTRMTDTSVRTEWMASVGIDIPLLSPWMDITVTGLAGQAERDWLRRLNDAMLAEAAASGAGVRTLAAVSLVDGDTAADDLVDAVDKLGAAGGYLTTSPADGRTLSDPSLRPLWTAAHERGIAIMLHPPSFGPSGVNASLAGFGNVYGRLIDTTIAAADLILSGLLDDLPELRILLVHGGGFLPYQSARLDGGYRAGESKRDDLKRPRPSDYLRRFRYDTVAMSAAAVRALVDIVGADRVALGTDFPFPIGDPAPLATLDATGLSETQCAAIRTDTATTLFSR